MVALEEIYRPPSALKFKGFLKALRAVFTVIRWCKGLGWSGSLMDSKSGSPARIHPCICGFECDKYSLMKKHREACAQWQNRPNPMRLMIERRHRTVKIDQVPRSEPCSICYERQDHHLSNCPNSQAERVRRELVARVGIEAHDWEVLLHLLGKRYR